MSRQHKTAMGKNIDMAALRAKNEKTRAIGNMNINARGDIIDSHDNVINDSTKRVNDFYMKGVINRRQQQVMATEGTKNVATSPAPKTMSSSSHLEADQVVEPPRLEPDRTPEEMEFDQEDEIEVPVKPTKNKK